MQRHRIVIAGFNPNVTGLASGYDQWHVDNSWREQKTIFLFQEKHPLF